VAAAVKITLAAMAIFEVGVSFLNGMSYTCRSQPYSWLASKTVAARPIVKSCNRSDYACLKSSCESHKGQYDEGIVLTKPSFDIYSCV